MARNEEIKIRQNMSAIFGTDIRSDLKAQDRRKVNREVAGKGEDGVDTEGSCQGNSG